MAKEREQGGVATAAQDAAYSEVAATLNLQDPDFRANAYALYEVLREHRRKPMRVLDLAWGGTRGLPIWKLGGVKYGPLLAHDEAAAYVQDLLAFGDLREVEPERYLWNETSEFGWALEATLKWEHLRYG